MWEVVCELNLMLVWLSGHWPPRANRFKSHSWRDLTFFFTPVVATSALYICQNSQDSGPLQIRSSTIYRLTAAVMPPNHTGITSHCHITSRCRSTVEFNLQYLFFTDDIRENGYFYYRKTWMILDRDSCWRFTLLHGDPVSDSDPQLSVNQWSCGGFWQLPRVITSEKAGLGINTLLTRFKQSGHLRRCHCFLM